MRRFADRSSLRAVRFSALGMAVAAASAPTVASPQDPGADARRDPPRHYYACFKERIAIEIIPDRIAVKSSTFPQRPEITLAPLGVKEEETLLRPIDEWAIAKTPEGSRSALGVEALADAASFLGATEFISPVFRRGDDDDEWLTITPEILIGFGDDVSSDAAKEILATFELEILEQDFGDMPGVFRVRGPHRSGLDVLDTANELAELDEVKFAEPDMLSAAKPSVLATDPFFSQLWGLHNIGQSGGVADVDMDAPEAWDITRGSSSIIVVVLDSGVDQAHPDINQIAGRDFTTGATGGIAGGGPVNSCDNHGTWVAGCISGRMNNGVGVVGVAPNCRVASARIAVSNVPCTGFWAVQSSWFVNALAWSRSIGARVTNHSGRMGRSSAIESAYASAKSVGLIHFAASGNDSAATIAFPASYNAAVNAVGAIDRTGSLAGFSNTGSGLDFVGPGVAIVTTDRSGAAGIAGDYAVVDGTSFASPYAAGVAALVLSKYPCLGPVEVESMMRASCVDLGSAGYDTTFGWGNVNARAALLARPADVLFPAPVTNVAASDGTMDSAVFVSWTRSTLAGGYDIYRSTSLNGTYSKVGEAHFSTSSWWYDFSATPGVTYYYKIRSLRSCLESDLSAANSGWRKLAPPQNVSATDGLIGNVGVAWSAVQGATHYRVYRGTTNNRSTAVALGTWQTGLSYSDSTAAGGTTYYYWVRAAINSSGSRPSDYSNPDTGRIWTISIPPFELPFP